MVFRNHFIFLNLRSVLDPSAGGFTGRCGKPTRSGWYPLGPDAAGRHQFFHIRTLAFGTFGRWVIGRQCQFFKTITAGFALVFVYRHGSDRLLTLKFSYIITSIPAKSSSHIQIAPPGVIYEIYPLERIFRIVGLDRKTLGMKRC